MKKLIVSSIVVTLFALSIFTGIIQADETNIYLIFYDGLKPITHIDSWKRIMDTAGFNLSNSDRNARADALANALLTSTYIRSRSLEIEPWFPVDHLDDVQIRDEKIAVWVTLPDSFLDSFNEAQSDRIAHAFSTTMDQLEIRSIFVFARQPKEKEYWPIDRFLPELPPIPKKPSKMAADTGERYPGQPGAPGQGQYAGMLNGKSVFINQAHGWYCHDTLGWVTQRGNTNDIVEDFINAEAINQYLVHYLWNAGAGVYTCRERDMNIDEHIIDNSDTGYSDSGGWSTSSTTSAYGGDNRQVYSSAVGDAEAIWVFSPAIDGYYFVYAWYSGGSINAVDAIYTIHHAGGSTHFVQNQQRDGYTWKCLGQYYFRSSDPADKRRVTLENTGSDPSKYVVADAIRFGGGMGSIEAGGSTSGRPRWEESGLYFAPYMGCDTCPTNTVSTMPRYAKWESESWEDSVYISWHTNAPNPGTGTSSFAYSSSGWDGTFNGVPNSLELRDYIHTELINDIRAGYDTGWTDRGTHTNWYGEINPTNNDEMPGAIIELAFHDTPADAEYLKDPKFRQLAARSFYQAVVKFYAWKDGTSVELLPESPEKLRLRNQPGNVIRVEWEAPPYDTGDGLLGDPATSYRIYISANGYGFTDAVTTSNAYYDVTGLEDGETIFVKVTAVNPGGESFPTPVLAARVPPSGSVVPLLFVDGFDRIDKYALIYQWESSALGDVARMFLDRMNTYNYTVTHAIAALGYPCGFDACVNEVVANGDLNLLNYQVVDWIVGENSTVDETLSSTEQSYLEDYMDGGGGLFISGAEIGWDLDNLGGSGDQAFYSDYLKAQYIADDAGVFSVSGRSGSIFDGLSGIAFDDGSTIYEVDYPDAIAPSGGSSICMDYDSTGLNAGVQFDGSFRMVHLAFPFETVVNSSNRAEIMERVLMFLLGTPSIIPSTSQLGLILLLVIFSVVIFVIKN